MKRLQLFGAITSSDYASVTNPSGSGTVIAQSRASLPIEIKDFYVKTMLENVRAELIHTQFAKKEALPEGNGSKVIEWRKWDTFDADTTALTEGITPDPQALGVSYVHAAVVQFGNWVPITDRLDWEAIDDVVLGATEELSAQAGITMDTYARDQIIAGATSVGIAGTNGSSTATIADLTSTAVLTSEEVNRAATVLKSLNVPKINGDYVCIIHPHVAMDLRNSEGWLKAHEYAKPEEIYNGEIGKLHGVRFVETSNAKVTAASSASNNLPVYDCLFLGKDAYGLVEPSGQSLEMIIKGKDQEGGPLNQRSTVGYKFSTAVQVLQTERIYNLKVTSKF